MTEFLDLLEGELRGAAERRWRSPRRSRRSRPRVVLATATVVAALVIAAIALTTTGSDHGSTPPAAAPKQTYVDSTHHFSVSYPAGWHRSTRRLTPALSDPREILAVGNGRLPVQHVQTDCAQLPSRALRALQAGQALVSIQERSRPGGGYKPRPARWEWERTQRADIECRPLGVSVRWLSFRDAGRGFYALVAIGPGSSAADGRRAIAVLNSFRPLPRSG